MIKVAKEQLSVSEGLQILRLVTESGRLDAAILIRFALARLKLRCVLQLRLSDIVEESDLDVLPAIATLNDEIEQYGSLAPRQCLGETIRRYLQEKFGRCHFPGDGIDLTLFLFSSGYSDRMTVRTAQRIVKLATAEHSQNGYTYRDFARIGRNIRDRTRRRLRKRRIAVAKEDLLAYIQKKVGWLLSTLFPEVHAREDALQSVCTNVLDNVAFKLGNLPSRKALQTLVRREREKLVRQRQREIPGLLGDWNMVDDRTRRPNKFSHSMVQEDDSAKKGNELTSNIFTALNTLDARTRTLIRMRYGLDCSAHKAGEVAKHFNMGTQGVRNIEIAGLQKLRKNKEFLGWLRQNGLVD